MFDKEAVMELIDLSKDTEPAMLDQIITNFGNSAPTLIGEIKMGYEANNLEDVEKAAHKLKGSAGILGLLDLAEKAFEVMLAARNRQAIDAASAAKNVQELGRLFQHSFLELNTFVSENRN